MAFWITSSPLSNGDSFESVEEQAAVTRLVNDTYQLGEDAVSRIQSIVDSHTKLRTMKQESIKFVEQHMSIPDVPSTTKHQRVCFDKESEADTLVNSFQETLERGKSVVLCALFGESQDVDFGQLEHSQLEHSMDSETVAVIEEQIQRIEDDFMRRTTVLQQVGERVDEESDSMEFAYETKGPPAVTTFV